jgi:hypothetical protein
MFYVHCILQLDREKFDEIFVDMKWFEAKTKHGFDKKPGKSKKKVGSMYNVQCMYTCIGS